MKNYFQKILSLFVERDYSKKTNQHFYRWLTDHKNEKEKDEALQLLYSEAKNQGEVSNLEESLKQWKQNIGNIPVSPKKKFGEKTILRLWQFAAAAMFITSIFLGYMSYNVDKIDPSWVQEFASTTQMKTFTLPDGSQVQMNSKSMLLYPQQFTGSNRSVYLVGEANFKVKSDKKKPFVVKTDDFQITALGTEFNVSAFAENKNVNALLISGSVLVEYDNLTKQVILKPTQQLVYNKENRQEVLSYPNMEDVTAWQRGELVFTQKTIVDIITVLERKYNYEFIYDLHSLKNDRYSFRFKDKASLAEVMDVIVDVAGNLIFQIQNDKCYIKKK